MDALFGVIVKVWGSGEAHEWRYVRKSLPSLLASDLPESARVILVDDCSPDPRVAQFLDFLAHRVTNVEVWRNPERLGPNKGQEYNIPRVWNAFPDAPFVVCCDDDVIYHPMWLRRLIAVYREAAEIGLRGIFTALNVPFRPSFRSIRLPTSEVLLKERQAALNWLVPRDVYEAVGPFRDVGIAYDTDYCNRMADLGLPVICLKPSYVQNIGYKGAYQCDDTYTAEDFVGRLDWDLRVRDFCYLLKRMLARLARPLWRLVRAAYR